jgi:hypothetical protein
MDSSATHRHHMDAEQRPYPAGVIVDDVDIRPLHGSEAAPVMTWLVDTFVRDAAADQEAAA